MTPPPPPAEAMSRVSHHPKIKAFDVIGEARVGEKLMACGDIENGETGGEDLCRFQWYRSLPDVASGPDATQSTPSGTAQPVAILGAFSPVYFVTPDDMGYVLSVIAKVDDATSETEEADKSPDSMRSAVADGGKVVTIGQNMKKYVNLQADGKSLLFKCKVIKLPGVAGGAAPPEDAEVIDGRVVFDEKNVTLFKHEAGPLLKLSLTKSAPDSIGLKEPSGATDVLVFKDSRSAYELTMEDRVRRDVCLVIYRSAIDKAKKTPQKRKSLFRR